MKNRSFAPWPLFDEEIISAVKETLVSGKVNQWTGHHVYAFEKEYAAYLGVKHAIARNAGIKVKVRNVEKAVSASPHSIHE